MISSEKLMVYGTTGHHSFHARVVNILNRTASLTLRFSHIWHSTWSDGEPGFCLDEPQKISDKHVLLFACPITTRIRSEMADLIKACKLQYGAKTLTLILGFLPFRRQDHEEKNNEITRLRWFIRDLKCWGVDHLVVCEPHSEEKTQEFCDEFGLKLWIADPTKVFVEAISGVVAALGKDRVRFYSPDLGSIIRSLRMAKAMGLQMCASPKLRQNNEVHLVEDSRFLDKVAEIFGDDAALVSCDLNDLAECHAFMREDELSTGRTSCNTAHRLKLNRIASVRLIATHPVCSPGWKMALFPFGELQPFDTIWFGDTRPRGHDETEYEGSTGGRIIPVSMAPVIVQSLVSVLGTLS
ncbi:MAG: hypothetical protein A3H72_02845 [Candidatus Doudnabacteria bacterium RIFCSPLOWO2_02_FULL_48_8]|nr:MAG: hypothetical protein A3H72_02845 [Candidatus Doudnabacteria bacterium RIFCSPLOWO2_02_FULL_48_8]